MFEKFLDKNKQLNINSSEIKALLSKYNDINKLAFDIAAFMQKKKITFPYQMYYMKDPYYYFNNLLNYKPTLSHKPFEIGEHNRITKLFSRKFKNDYLSIIATEKEFFHIDRIIDYFTEYARMKANRYDQKYSPFEWYSLFESKIKIISDLIRNNKDICSETLREEIYKNVKECSVFRVSYAKTLIQLLKGTKILDFSAGWGDRLIGAIASGAKKYTSFDPNTSLKKGHNTIIKTLCSKENQKNFKIQYIPFEKAKFKKNDTYDLILTSPPYFNLEIYSDDKGQSVNNYNNIVDWLIYFLFKSLEKGWNQLEENGILAIHIQDFNRIKITEIMNLFILSFLPNSHYLGVIGLIGESKIARPVWVWRKVEKEGHQFNNIRLTALQIIKNNFNQIYPLVIKEGFVPLREFISQQLDLSDKTILPLTKKVESVKISNYILDDNSIRHVIRDDVLYAGTKQRVAEIFVKKNLPPNVDTLLYTSSYNGYGAVITSYVAKKLGLNSIVILCLKPFGESKIVPIEEAENHTSVKKIRELGATIIYTQKWNELIEIATSLTKKQNIWWLPLGFKDEEFIKLFPKYIPDLSFIKRLWIVGSSGTLSKALSIALPNTRIFVVPVDIKNVSFNKLQNFLKDIPNITIITKPIPNLIPPYPSIIGYDSKAWAASVVYGKDGDYVWNVASG